MDISESRDENKLGEGYDWGGRTPNGYPDMDLYDYTYQIEKQIIIQPHKTEKIICYITPQPSTNINIGWDYEISASFN